MTARTPGALVATGISSAALELRRHEYTMLRMMSSNHFHERPGGLRLLGLCIDARVREGGQDLLESRDRYAHATKRTRAIEVLEAVPGIERLDLVECFRCHRALTIRGTVHVFVVNDHEVSVPRESNVQLEHVGAPPVDRPTEGRHGVFWRDFRSAAMRHEQGRSGEIRAPGPGGHHTHVGGRLRGGVPTGFGQLYFRRSQFVEAVQDEVDEPARHVHL